MTLLTAPFRINFPKLEKAEVNPKFPKNDPRFSLQAIFDDEKAVTPIKEAIIKVCTDKFGANQATWPKGLKLPKFEKMEATKADAQGNVKAVAGYKPGAVTLSLGRPGKKGPPAIFDVDGTTALRPSDIYSGCYVRSHIDIFVFDTGGDGVTIWFGSIQKVRDGEPLGGNRADVMNFAPVESTESGKSAASMFD